MEAKRAVGVWLCLLLASACGRAGTSASPAATTAPVAQAGVERTWPRPAVTADSADSVLVLMTPHPRHAAARVVEGFFDAVRRESLRDLDALLSEDATLEAGPGTAPEPVSKVWSARFKRLDYAFNGAKAPYRLDDVGLFTRDEVTTLAPIRRFELVPGPRELLAVVTTRDRRHQTGPRHFGRRIEFILGEGPGGLWIRRVFEDYRVP